MYKKVFRGEIWIVNWNPGRGSEQNGLRPSLVIQNDMGSSNPNYGNVIVLAISTKSSDIPFHIEIKPNTENGLNEKSFVKCEQIMTISKDRLISKVGNIDRETLLKIFNTLIQILS
jgi:mRNA interferase MazF